MMDRVSERNYRKEWMGEIMKLANAKLRCLNEILRLTKEISEGLNRNDRVSVQLLLEMRGKELETIDSINQKFYRFKEQFPEETQKEIEDVLQGDLLEPYGEESAQIAEIIKNCNKVLEQTAVIDKFMSKRIAGSESFYE